MAMPLNTTIQSLSIQTALTCSQHNFENPQRGALAAPNPAGSSRYQLLLQLQLAASLAASKTAEALPAFLEASKATVSQDARGALRGMRSEGECLLFHSMPHLLT